MLTAATATFGRREYAILGRLLLSKKPDIANELITAYLPHEEPKETELNKVYKLLMAFCAVNNLSISDCTGPGRSQTTNRRIFICCIIHLYAPQFLNDTTLYVNRGLVLELTKILHSQRDRVSRLIRQAILWKNSYPDFAEQVQISLAKMEELRS
jgi:hypothetical protein